MEYFQLARTNPETIQRYKKTVSENVKAWRKRTKLRIIAAMGEKCQCCGYNRCHKALDLHHIDPTQKEKSFNQLMAHPTAIEKWFDEFRKCVLVCSNCHREIHEGMTEVPENYVVFNQELFENWKAMKIIEIFNGCEIIQTENGKFTYRVILGSFPISDNRYKTIEEVREALGTW